ncbi:twin-arginine translocation signal domain-containing protein [Aquincola sp. MAHUQ-54]|uniref:Twin-arginine translocation signal domain-containing protein n=1 Tax=Aquincola agrisoli TaxID=3119538 RepID=A0AAW9QCZ8_9BURK
MERRSFLSGAAASAVAGLAAKEAVFPGQAHAQATSEQVLVTSVWSRHVQWVRTEEQTYSDPYGTGVAIGEALRAGGYAAVNLTVRDGGHVRPAQVSTHLPLMLNGIRSTGTICDHIGVNVTPPADPANTAWIASQFVHEILSVASAHGIKKYRFSGVSFPANTFGQQMTSYLDGLRLNLRRLAAINAQYGKLCGVAHTHGNNVGTTVEPYAYAMQGIDPNLIGINLAIGHVATAAPGTAWQIAMRRWMPHIKCVCPEDVAATINATTGALSVGRTKPGGATGNGGGVINWATFYSLLRIGGYSGAAENQLEYTIVGGTGTNVSLNNGAFANSSQFTSGQLTPEIMIAEFKQNSDFIRSRALLGGWAASQII